MFGHFESFSLVVLEIICCMFFFETFAQKKDENNHLRNYGSIVGLILFVFLAAWFLTDYFLIKQILVIIVTAILMELYLKVTLGQSIILSAIYQGLLLVLDYLTLLICEVIFDDVYESDMLDGVQGYIIVLMAKTVLFLIVLFLRKKIGRNSSIKLLDTDWLRFIFFPIFTVCTLSVLLAIMRNPEDQQLEIMFFVIALGLAGMNIVVFYLINDILKRELKLRESQFFQLEVKNQTNMYRSISDNFAKQRKRTHEYNNQMLCIESLIRKKAYDELAEYVSGLSGHLSKDMDYISTNHVIVDAILNAKYNEMLSQNILFVFKINDLAEINISDEDIVIILSNLLNNAIEACELCQNKKVIKLKFIKEDESVIISVKNTYENKIVRDGVKFQSTKMNNSGEHGIGITNLIDTIEKYGGSYAIQEREKEFFFSIIIPCPKM